jgi:hypothetical protein
VRMLLKAHMDTRKANEGNQDGTLQERLGQLLDRLQPKPPTSIPKTASERCSSSSTCKTHLKFRRRWSRCSRRGGERLPYPGDDPRGPAVWRSGGLRLSHASPLRGLTVGGGAA